MFGKRNAKPAVRCFTQFAITANTVIYPIAEALQSKRELKKRSRSIIRNISVPSAPLLLFQSGMMHGFAVTPADKKHTAKINKIVERQKGKIMIKFNDKIIIGIDHGYGNMKTANHHFKSGIMCFNSKPLFTKNMLVYENRYYLIGEGHKEFTAEKVNDEDYYVLTLAAVATELEDSGITNADVILAVGLPLTWTAGQNEKFSAYLSKNETVDFNYHHRDYHIKISGVKVYPQGYAAVADIVSQMNSVNMIADIGNGTMNILQIINKFPITKTMATEKYGTYQCTLAVREQFTRRTSRNIDDSIIDEVFINGTADIGKEDLKIIKEVAGEYVSDIFRRLREHGYDENTMKLYITGGGGCLVKHFYKYNPNRVIFIDDICAAAKGYENLADIQLRKNEII